MDKIVIIGGGISGFIAAINAKNSNNEVIILERNDKPLKKLLLTGNGKCNYFNEDFNISHYYSNDIDILSKFINSDNKKKILDFYNIIGIVPRIKNGYYYPYSNQAITVKNALLEEANLKGVLVKTNSYVKSIVKCNDVFEIKLQDSVLTCNKLIISTGSKAYPKTGSDGNGYDLAKSFGHSIVDLIPSLGGLVCEGNYFKLLNGVRCSAKVSLYENNLFIKDEIGEVQFTNYGLSGICIFNLSGMAGKGLNLGKCEEIHINFLNELGINKKEEFFIYMDKRNSIVEKRTISQHLDNLLNYKVTNVVLNLCNIDKDKLYSELNDFEKEHLAHSLLEFDIKVKSTNSFDNAQVCMGGVPLSEVDECFMSKFVSNLYFTGELLDVCGDCGGYNIGFASLSAIIAGESAGDNNA